MSEDLLRARAATAPSGAGTDGTKHLALQYELFAVVCHHGNQSSKGHYTCFCKASCHKSGIQGESVVADSSGADARWRSFNDTEVTEVSEEEALQAKSIAYILFYRLR
jgi:ubiquitin C-terminal hydrolase